MKLSVLVNKERNMGDHGERILVAYEAGEKETLEALALRLLFDQVTSSLFDPDYERVIEIRLMRPFKEEVA